MAKFLSGSILLHVLVILVLGQHGFFAHTLDSRKTNPEGARLVSVMIAASHDGESRPLLEKPIAVKGDALTARETGVYKDIAPAGAAAAKKDSLSGRGNGGRIGANDKEKYLQDADFAHDYFLAGWLTRLPAPLAPVDLNIPPITNRAATRPLEITLFIDAAGVVSDIVSSDNDEMARELFDLVALQFRNARFSPGEIDGRKVNSRITITVISEPA